MIDAATLDVIRAPFREEFLAPLPRADYRKTSRRRLSFGKILIVDDNDIDQLRATVVSSELGATVEVVSSGRAALAALESSDDVRLVLMDCDMPEMSGLETTRQWRRIESGMRSQVPIVGLSRHSSTDYALCVAAGMNDLLTKPLDRDAVARCFRRWMQASHPADTCFARTSRHEA